MRRHFKEKLQGILPESALGTSADGTAIADGVRDGLEVDDIIKPRGLQYAVSWMVLSCGIAFVRFFVI